MTHASARQRGYNLVEVLIAMGLLSTVLIAIVTLFVMGRTNVYSGKQMTHAVSIGTSVIEDLNPMTLARSLSAFGIDVDSSLAAKTVAGVEYEDAILRSTDDLADDVDGYLDRWDDLIPEQRLANGRISLIFQPRELTDANDVTTARILQMKVIVEWTEAQRRRTVLLETSKLSRL
jgi:prepilin-type N-terminal cleavage/methylation domain-containing protein